MQHVQRHRQRPRLGEHFDLLAHHVYSAIVARVELQNELAILVLIEFASQSDNSGSLASAGRPIEEQVGQRVLIDEALESVEYVFVGDKLVEGGWPVLLYPGQVGWLRLLDLHGRVFPPKVI